MTIKEAKLIVKTQETRVTRVFYAHLLTYSSVSCVQRCALEGGGVRGGGGIKLFTRAVGTHVCFCLFVLFCLFVFVVVVFCCFFFLPPALSQTRNYSISNYTSTHFLSYDTPVHTSNK